MSYHHEKDVEKKRQIRGNVYKTLLLDGSCTCTCERMFACSKKKSLSLHYLFVLSSTSRFLSERK